MHTILYSAFILILRARNGNLTTKHFFSLCNRGFTMGI